MKVNEPITSEWLLKYGLNKPIGIHNDMFSGLISVGILTDKCVFFIGNTEICYIKYTSQLKNIIFDLTGNELKPVL